MGKLYRTTKKKSGLKTADGKTNIIEVGETVRKGSARSQKRSSKITMAIIGNVSMMPLCFQDDVAAMGNSRRDAMRTQSAMEMFKHRKLLQLDPEKSQMLIIGRRSKQNGNECNLKKMEVVKQYR